MLKIGYCGVAVRYRRRLRGDSDAVSTHWEGGRGCEFWTTCQCHMGLNHLIIFGDGEHIQAYASAFRVRPSEDRIAAL
jgi:hypothetical protein